MSTATERAVALRPRAGGLHDLRRFVEAFGALLDRTDDERVVLGEGANLLARLIAADDWLPASHAIPDPVRYRQYLLYRDPAGRFSVVSFVWAPGQRTPIHDHRVWGLVGVLRGGEIAERYDRHGGLRLTGSERLDRGAVDAVSPTVGDLHRVANAFDDRTTISIHVYGADIGTVERATYDIDGTATPFVSGYADAPPLVLFERAA